MTTPNKPAQSAVELLHEKTAEQVRWRAHSYASDGRLAWAEMYNDCANEIDALIDAAVAEAFAAGLRQVMEDWTNE